MSHMNVLKGTLTQLNLLYKECSYDNDNFRYDFSTIHPETLAGVRTISIRNAATVLRPT